MHLPLLKPLTIWQQNSLRRNEKSSKESLNQKSGRPSQTKTEVKNLPVKIGSEKRKLFEMKNCWRIKNKIKQKNSPYIYMFYMYMFLFPHFVAFEISVVQVFVSFSLCLAFKFIEYSFSSCSVASLALITIVVQIYRLLTTHWNLFVVSKK